MANDTSILRLRTDPDASPLTRGFQDGVILVLNSLLARSQITRSSTSNIPEFSIHQSLAANGGLQLNGAGELTIKLAPTATAILNLTSAGLGFGNQSGNTVLASPANTGANGPPTFRSLVANDIPSLNYQPLDSDLTSIAGLTGNGCIPYRIAIGNWAMLSIGSNLTFADGVLNASSSGGGGAGTIGFGAFSSRPAAAAGSMYVSSDGPAISIANATDWFNLTGGHVPTLEFSNTAFTTVIDANASVTHLQGKGFVELYHSGPTNNVDRHNHGRMKTLAAGNFTVVAAVELSRSTNGGDCKGGILLRDSGGGKMMTFQRWDSGVNESRIHQAKWSANTTFDADLNTGSQQFFSNRIHWLKLTWDGTTLTSYWSPDGDRYYLHYAWTVAGYFTPDQIGYSIENFGSARDMALKVWQFTVN